MRRTSRDLARAVEHRPLARFRREVAALLVTSHRTDSARALSLLAKWDKFVRYRWSHKYPACNVADHIAKYEKQRVVCPCVDHAPPGFPAAARDPDCKLPRRFSKRVRQKLPLSGFAIPERKAWPIHDVRHALLALRYMRDGKGNRADYPRVRKAIRRRYPWLRGY